MKIDEAIEELKRGTRQSRSTNNQRLREALRLGINALIFYRKLNASNTGEIQGNFLGEDPEEKQ